LTVRVIPAIEAAQRLGEFSQVIDARSESEYAEDRLPGAVNWPSLNDEERHRRHAAQAGQRLRGPQARRRHGHGQHLAPHRARDRDKPQDWQPLVYCWRGGKRSGVLADWCWTRSASRSRWSRAATRPSARRAGRPAGAGAAAAVPRGLRPTGSGKTRLLQALAAQARRCSTWKGWRSTAARCSA
jgi:tRNA 2-selenouridine synthase